MVLGLDMHQVLLCKVMEDNLGAAGLILSEFLYWQ